MKADSILLFTTTALDPRFYNIICGRLITTCGKRVCAYLSPKTGGWAIPFENGQKEIEEAANGVIVPLPKRSQLTGNFKHTMLGYLHSKTGEST